MTSVRGTNFNSGEFRILQYVFKFNNSTIKFRLQRKINYECEIIIYIY
jgi:hypothetical protein